MWVFWYRGFLVSQTDESRRSTYGDFDGYRVFLSFRDLDYPDAVLGCTLVKKSFNPSQTTGINFTVRIPSSVGPAGSPYFLDVEQFIDAAEKDPCGASIPEYDAGISNPFVFSGATGNWSQRELDG